MNYILLLMKHIYIRNQIVQHSKFLQLMSLVIYF